MILYGDADKITSSCYIVVGIKRMNTCKCLDTNKNDTGIKPSFDFYFTSNMDLARDFLVGSGEK